MQFPGRTLRLAVLAPLLTGLAACLIDPTGTYVAADKFDRVVASGWGSSDIGGPYTYAGNGTFRVDQEGQATLARGGLASATVGMPATRRTLTRRRSSAPIVAVPVVDRRSH